MMNHRNMPFLRLSIAFISGLILGETFPQNAPTTWLPWLSFGGLALLLTAGWQYTYARRWIFGMLSQLDLGLFGFIYIQVHDEQSATD